MNNLLTSQATKDIQSQANLVLQNYATILDPLDRLLKIAEDHKIKVLEADLFEMSGALRKEGSNWLIYVNKQDSSQRKLFTIAHELGHFFVHKNICNEFIDGQLISRNEQQKYAVEELEANEFAGNLIMPESQIRLHIGSKVLTAAMVLELAQTFGVSAMAMATRLRNLHYDVPGYKS